MIALVPAVEYAEKFTVDAGLDQDDLHVTLAFLGESDLISPAAENFADMVSRELASAWGGGISGSISGFGYLGDEDPPATILLLNGNFMDQLRIMLWDALGSFGWGSYREQYRPWIPHMTVGYGTTPPPFEVGETVFFDRIRFAHRNMNFDYRFDGLGKVWQGSFFK